MRIGTISLPVNRQPSAKLMERSCGGIYYPSVLLKAMQSTADIKRAGSRTRAGSQARPVP